MPYRTGSNRGFVPFIAMAIFTGLFAAVPSVAQESRIKVHKDCIEISQPDQNNSVSVKGKPGAVESSSPPTLQIINQTTKETIEPPLNPDGSFEASLHAAMGDKIRVLAKNADKKRSYGTFTVGEAAKGGNSDSEIQSISASTASPSKFPNSDELRNKLKSIFHVTREPTETLPSEPQIVNTEDCGTFLRESIQYNVSPDKQRSGELFRPKTFDSPLPLIIYLAPQEKHKTSQEPADASSDSPASHPDRDPPSIPADIARLGFLCFSPDSMDPIEILLAVDWLISQPDAAPGSIGIIGCSSLGFHAMKLAALDPRIQAIVIADSAFPFDKRLWLDPALLQKLLDSPASASDPLLANAFWMAASPKPFLCIARTKEQEKLSKDFPLIQEFYKKTPPPQENASPPVSFYFHNNPRTLESDVRQLAYAWLTKQLKANAP